jgi:hypothetical protein
LAKISVTSTTHPIVEFVTFVSPSLEFVSPGLSNPDIPQNVLHHFPLIRRLRRVFASKQMAKDAQWHKLKRKEVQNELNLPAHVEAWKYFDRKYG